MGKIYFIRHGESEMNAMQDSLSPENKIVLGQCNWASLSPEGIEQAKKVGTYLSKEGVMFDYVTASYAVRTQQTASFVLREMLDRDNFYKKINNVKLSESLLERSMGDWDFEPKVNENIVNYQRLLKEDSETFWKYSPPSGESYADVSYRVRKFIEENLFGYETSAVFTHRGCICSFLIDTFKLYPDDIIGLWMGPGSISTVTFDNKQWKNYKPEIYTP